MSKAAGVNKTGRCPLCGAEYDSGLYGTALFKCGTIDGRKKRIESYQCLRNQLAQAKAELEKLRRRTNERYLGKK